MDRELSCQKLPSGYRDVSVTNTFGVPFSSIKSTPFQMRERENIKPWIVSCSESVLQDNQTFQIHFNLVNSNVLQFK